MEQILMNQKLLHSRKDIKKILKKSNKRYLRGKSVSRTKIGKLVELSTSDMDDAQPISLRESVNIEGLLDMLDSSKLTGMSGNGYSVKTKLESIINTQHDKILIVNGAECEPGLLHDEWLINNRWDEIVMGINALNEIIPFTRSILAYKVLKADRKNPRTAEGIEVRAVPANFPMGEERVLVKQLLGIAISKEEYPAEHGILVMNVQSIYQIYRLLTGQYDNGRYITMADLRSGEAKVVYVKRGESIREKIKTVFSASADDKYFAGAGMMSAHLMGEDESFSDTVSFAAVGEPAALSNEVLCKGCGKCSHKCPAGVNVKEIVKRREKDFQADLSGTGIENCIQCGSCTYFCRAGKNVREYVTV